MKEKFSKKVIMIIIIAILTALNVFLLAIHIVNAEEKEAIDADPILEGTLEKYINYAISDDDKGTLVQYHLRTGINYKNESKTFPIKENEVNISIAQIDGKYPDKVKTIINSSEATNGNNQTGENSSSEYNPDTGILTIKMDNQDDDGNMISDKIPDSNAKDDYVIICYYDTYTENQDEREMALEVSSKITLFSEDNKEITGQGEIKKKVSENIGDLTSIGYDTEDVYNGYIKSNIINDTEYNTQYTEKETIDISKKEAHQKIEITEENTFVRTDGEKITKDLGNNHNLVYKRTKFEKDNITKILGEEGVIQILDADGNILATIDKDTEFAEDGTLTIEYENDIEKLIIKTSNIVSEGTLYIENTKEIKSTMQDIENVKIKTTTNISGINEETVVSEENGEEKEAVVEKEVYKKASENIVDIKEAQDNVNINISSSEWTNKQQNEITFDINLDATSSQYNLFKNPQLKIELPSQVEKVILGDSSIVYGNGLELQDPIVETDKDGNFNIVANLTGEQTQYTEKSLGLITDVKISATIILKKDIENTTDKINFVYTNAYTLDNKTEEKTIQKEIKMQSYNKEESMPTEMQAAVQAAVNDVILQQSVDSLNMQVTAKKGDVTLNDNDVVYAGEYVKYSIKVTNITSETVNNVKVVASIPDGVTYGELEADYYSYNGEYKYNFDSNVKEKTIEIGTLRSGESKEVFYEVQVNNLASGEDQKEITTNIKSYVGNAEANSWNLKNIINSSEATIFVDARRDNGENRWNYNVYIRGQQGKEVTVQIKLPEAFIPNYFVYDGYLRDQIPSDNITVSEDNVLTTTLTIDNGLVYVFEGDMDESKIDKNIDASGTTLVATSSISLDGKTYYGNETRIFYEFPNVKISMTSPTEGQKISYEDEIEYDITVENIGGSNYKEEESKSVSVNLTDYLPEDINPVSVTYENYEPITEVVTDEDGKANNVVKYERKVETVDISAISSDQDGNKLPNVDVTLLIPKQESVTMKIIATAGYVYEETKIENSATVVSRHTTTDDEGSNTVITLNKTSNTVSHTILPANTAFPDDSEDPDNPNPEDPDNPNPDNPNNPDAPNNPNNPGEGSYSISGLAWVDDNEDGERQSTEELVNGITVMLLDTEEANAIKAQKQTDANGAYSFTDVEAGSYIVVFRYDTNNYQLTEYRKSGVSDNLNSDVSGQEMTIEGQRTLVGATDVLTVNNNTSNIDMGLIENKLYDLKLEKSITKVTVQTNQKTSTYGYDHEELVKVDIRSKEIEGAKVTVEYKIVVTNEGELTATVGSVADYLPEGFTLSTDVNQNWMRQTDGKYINTSTTNQRIAPGQSVTLTLTATKTMTANNTGIFINKAEIEEASSINGTQDVDSTPGNNVETEDDFSKAEVIISIGTGIGVYISIGVILAVLIVIAIMIGVKKGKIKFGKISKISMFIIMFAVVICFQTTNSLAIKGKYLPEVTYWNFDGDTYKAGGGSFFDNENADGTPGSLPRGACIDHGVHNADEDPPRNRRYTLASEDITTIETGAVVKTGSISLSKGNSSITMKQLDDNNYLLGPFVIKCNNSNGYTFEIKDGKGNDITGFSTCNSSGNSITVKGNATFYIKIPASKCKNGISKVKATNTASVTATQSVKLKVYGIYKPDKGSEYQRVAVTIYKNDTTTTTTTDSQSVEWKDINGGLEIFKKDADNTNIKLPGVQIRVQNAVTGYNKTFTTDSNGKIHIDNLSVGTYTITEVSNNNYGYSEVESGKVTVYSGKISAFDLLNKKQTGNLTIYKKDENTKIGLPGVSFKIKDSSGKYIIGVNSGGNTISRVTGTVHLSNMQTTSDSSKATEFITDSNGCIQIYNLLTDTYTVSEISVGSNFGYEVDNNYISWQTSGAITKGNNAKITVTRQTSSNTGTSSSGGDKVSSILNMMNRKKYIKISGYAWEDKVKDKKSDKDYLWKSGTEDKRLQYVTVRLKKSDGELIASTTTNANGEYKFGYYDISPNTTKVKIDDLKGAYVEFEYNGMSYKTISINEKATNGNKATDTALRNAFNDKYATISKGIASNTKGNKTYDIRYKTSNHTSTVNYGNSSKYGYSGQTYPISGVDAQYIIQAITTKKPNNVLCTTYTPDSLRESGTNEITNINLGLEERDMPDLAIVEDMEKVEISLNDYTHTYQYAQRYEDPKNYAGGDGFNLTVKFANKYLTNSYSREVYSSDIVYNKQPGNAGKLKVFVTYRLKLRNESTNLYSNIKTLSNYYDARYENIVVKDANGKTIQSSIDNSYNSNGFKKLNIQLNMQIEYQDTKEITITYQLNNDAINSILKNEITLDSVTEITSYSTYSDKGYKTVYAGIDVDSAPDNATPMNTDTYEDDTDRAPALTIKPKEERVIQGTVWEDSAIETLLNKTGYQKERKGNGIYETNENIVNNVKVELMSVNASGNLELAKLYKKNNTVVDATTTTSGKGAYSFVGVEPGNYVLRYTYGDNSVICDSSGKTIKNVNIDNYKSTIYRGGNKDAVNAMTDYWYRGETSNIAGVQRLSDAKDNEEFVNDRITEDEIDYESATESRDLTEISADTRMFDIKLDYDVNLDNISKFGADLKFVFDNIDFGIIERPRQSLLVDKQIANIKLSLTNGNTIIDGDPRSQNLSGVKVLDDDVYIEVDNEIIQGATLKITYEITVDNRNCEIDYNNEDYYIYGIVPSGHANWKIATVVDMYDYLPEEVVLESNEGNNWERIQISNDMKGKLLSEQVYEKVKGLQNIIHLKNPIFESMTPGSEAVDTSMVVSKQLSSTADDLTYENDVEIIKLKGRKTIDSVPGNYDPTTNSPDEADDDSVILTITGPTGENRQYIIYGIIGITLLVIIGVGIIIIKRKVLKK